MTCLRALALASCLLVIGQAFSAENYRARGFALHVLPASIKPSELGKLRIGVEDRAFAVTVNNEVIYTGAFWTPVSSVSFGGVVVETAGFDKEYPVLALKPGYSPPA